MSGPAVSVQRADAANRHWNLGVGAVDGANEERVKDHKLKHGIDDLEDQLNRADIPQ
jgi:hypothetical protein